MSQSIIRLVRAARENIRDYREKKGYSQLYVAQKLAISQNAYSKIELGFTKLTVHRLLQLAEILEVGAAELLAERPLGRRKS